MITTEHFIGEASIYTAIRPLSKDVPISSSLVEDVEAFLALMERADRLGLREEFGRLLAAFLDEVDSYLDVAYLVRP